MGLTFEHLKGGGCDCDEAQASEKKTRFIWTPELHSRFETPCTNLEARKPYCACQASVHRSSYHLMGCDEEGARAEAASTDAAMRSVCADSALA